MRWWTRERAVAPILRAPSSSCGEAGKELIPRHGLGVWLNEVSAPGADGGLTPRTPPLPEQDMGRLFCRATVVWERVD